MSKSRFASLLRGARPAILRLFLAVVALLMHGTLPVAGSPPTTEGVPHAVEGAKESLSWQLINSVGPAGFSSSMAYDYARTKPILFNATSGEEGVNELWEWDGSQWRKILAGSASSPSPKSAFAVASDSARKRIVQFGGNDMRGRIVDEETWEWDGEEWELAATTGPSPRILHQMVYDSIRGRVVLFGGVDQDGAFSMADTWEWDGMRWQQMMVSGPPARHGHAMAFDSARGRTVLFGGAGLEPPFGIYLKYADTWEWDGTIWRQVASAGPSEREGHMMVYDEKRDRSLLFGGRISFDYPTTSNNETWEWDGQQWSQLPLSGPSARSGHAMTYDVAQQEAILFGGVGAGSTYVRDTWRLRSPAPGPPSPPASITYPSASSTGSYTVSWDSSPEASAYALQRSNNHGSTWAQVYDGSSSSFEEKIGNGSYRYRVQASNGAGASEWRVGTYDCAVNNPLLSLHLPSFWYLAEGATHPGFETYYLIANPNGEPLQVDVEYLPETGPPIFNSITVPANSRYTIKANDILPNQGLSASFRSPAGKAFAVERAMYSLGGNGRWHGAHATVGISSLRPEWFLAEGATSAAGPSKGFFQTFILLSNPNYFPVDVDITYYPEGGESFVKEHVVGPKSRLTLEPGTQDQRLVSTSFSTRAVVKDGHGIVVERAMWWRATNWPAESLFMEGTASPGVSELSATWYLAEGDTEGFDDFILLVNPNDTPANVNIRYFREDAEPIDRPLIIAANQRRTIHVRWDAEGMGTVGRHGTMVTSSIPLAMERSMYFTRGEIGWVGGHNTIGSSGLSTKWLLPEGATVPVSVGNLRTEILLANPNNVPATAEVRFLLSDGGLHVENITIAAERRYTLVANEIPELASQSFSILVVSNEAIVVERSMYFDGETPGLLSPIGGTNSLGIPAAILVSTPKGFHPEATNKNLDANQGAWTPHSSPTPTASVTPTVSLSD